MTDLVASYKQYLPPSLRNLAWRAHLLEQKLLLFERNTGMNVLLEGKETAHLRRVAPRTLLIAVTNSCNLGCLFCYRDPELLSLWRYETLLEFCQQADEWGVLEVAFGGGEPMIFPRWQDLICELYETTGLCVNFTTNGMLLTEDFLRAVAGCYGQIRLSIYDDNNWPETFRLLVRTGARFGVNWLITRSELQTIEEKFAQLLELGAHDFLLLSYKGCDTTLHFDQADYQRLEHFVNRAYIKLGQLVTIKLDVCWGNCLPNVLRLFEHKDCGASDDFLSITSDKQIKPCSFHHVALPFETLNDVRTYWKSRCAAQAAALIAGCARLPRRGLNVGG
jgi:MoaA/NifB/PqqE/SkfB family radical SAM enzyme